MEMCSFLGHPVYERNDMYFMNICIHVAYFGSINAKSTETTEKNADDGLLQVQLEDGTWQRMKIIGDK